MTTISDLIVHALLAVTKFKQARDNRAAHYWEGRLTALEQAKACRLTDAETAVIEAALAMTGERSSRLSMALGALRKERGMQSVPYVEQVAERVIADGAPQPRPKRVYCSDCGSSCHATDSVYCPVRQQDDCDD